MTKCLGVFLPPSSGDSFLTLFIPVATVEI
jgi:hypothetical protein